MKTIAIKRPGFLWLLPAMILAALLLLPALLSAAPGADTSPPVISSTQPSNGTWQSSTSATIVANYSDDESGIDQTSVTVYLNGSPLISCSVGDTAVSCQTDSLQIGQNNASVSVSDNADNRSSYDWRFGVDNEAPTFYNQHPTGSIGETKPSIGVNFTDSASGINPGMTRMYLDGQDVTWSSWFTWDGIDYTPTSPLAPGPHTVKVSTTDQAYNEGVTTWSFNVSGSGGGDQYGPAITPPGLCGGSTDDSTPTITFGYSDESGIDTASVTLVLDGETKAAAVSQYQASYTPPSPLAEGSHTVSLSARDTKGNQSSHSCSFTIAASQPGDSTPPVIAEDEQPADGSTIDNGAPVITVSWSDEGGAGIDQYSGYMEVDGEDVSGRAYKDERGIRYNTCIWCETSVPLADGAHTVAVSVRDKAGNLSATKRWSFTVDTSNRDTKPPVIAGDEQPADGSTIESKSPRISVSWSDAGAGIDQYSSYLELDGTDVSGAAIMSQYGVSYQASDLSEGSHTVVASVRDKAGNISETRLWSFKVAPAPTPAQRGIQLEALARILLPAYGSQPAQQLGVDLQLFTNPRETQASLDLYLGGIHLPVSIAPQLPPAIANLLGSVYRTGEEPIVSDPLLRNLVYYEAPAALNNFVNSDSYLGNPVYLPLVGRLAGEDDLTAKMILGVR